MDVGTGDGRAVLERAALEPETLVFGLDANASAMAEASRRAARPPRKGGRPNVRFVLAAAEAPPPVLAAAAELVTVRFPWGSLLQGCLGLDPAVACGLAGLVAPGGTLELLLAPSVRDGLTGIPTDPSDIVAATSAAFAGFGFELRVGRRASATELEASGSSWAKRLGAAGRAGRGRGGATGAREVTLVRLARRRRRRR